MAAPKQYQEMIKDGCPWCGEPLELKQGKFGEFVACSEWCGYTKSVSGRSEYPPPKPKNCPYKKCDGSGLIPFIKKGKTIPFVWVHCECHEDKEPYQSHQIEDFDFPMSDTFRAYSYQYCNESDPGYVPIQRDIDREMDEDVMAAYFTGRYLELPKMGYEENYQKNKRGIITRLTQLEDEVQEHFKAYSDKKKNSYTIK